MHATVSDWRAVLAGALVQNRMRTLVAVLAIALGVALGLAVQLVNQAALDELAHGVRTLSGDADLSVRGARTGFPERLYGELARDADVAIASPMVELMVAVRDRDEPLRMLGLDAFRAALIQPGLVVETDDRLDVLRPDKVFLSNAAMRALDAAVGDTIAVGADRGDVRLVVAGTLAGAAGERLAVMDIAALQDAFGWAGRLSRIELRLRDGVPHRAFAERVRATLPAGVVIDRPDATLRATSSISRSYRINLNVLALVALFTGSLLVFTTQALGVVRRRSQFALLRTLGVSRGRLAFLCATEGALIGVAGSALGVAAGYAIAWIALRVAGGDLGSGYFRGVEARVAFDAASSGLFFVLGIAAAVLGALVPAREAARAPVALALRAGDEESALRRLRPARHGIVVIVAGVLLVPLPPVAGLPLAGYAAIACMLVGALMAMPALSSFVLDRLPLPRRAPAALALAQLRGASGRVSVSLAAIVASVSLMVSMAIMVGSFRQSLDDWLVRVLPADLYARVASPDVGPLSEDEQLRISLMAGIARVDFTREMQLLLDPARPRVVLIARPLDEAHAAARLVLTSAPVPRPADAPPPLWANEAMLDLYGFAPGRIVTLPIAGRDARFFVAGVWRDYGRPQGAVVIDRAAYIASGGDRAATNAAIWLASPSDAGRVRESLLRAVGGEDRLDVAVPGEIRSLALSAFDRTFAVTYALEIAAVAIGLVGLSSAFGALVLARRREFGVLRHLGMTRKDVGTMLASEGLVSGALGVAAGTVLGGAISLVLVHVVNRQSFHWGMELHVPWSELALLCAAVIALATLTAVASGRRAMGGDVVRAVREDW